MNTASYIILLIVAVATAFAVRSALRNSGKSCGCDNCDKCSSKGHCTACDKSSHKHKSLTLVLLLAGAALPACAGQTPGDTILSRILEAHRDVATIQSSFTHQRTNSRGKTTVSKGNFYYIDSTRQMAMRYTQPHSMYFIVSNNYLYNGLNKIPLHFNMKRNDIMRALGNAMVWAVRGEVQRIIDDNNVITQIYEEKGYYVITMTARSGFNRGITRIVLKYEKEHCLLRHMEVDEIVHVSHLFMLGDDTKTNRPIEKERFVLK